MSWLSYHHAALVLGVLFGSAWIALAVVSRLRPCQAEHRPCADHSTVAPYRPMYDQDAVA